MKQEREQKAEVKGQERETNIGMETDIGRSKKQWKEEVAQETGDQPESFCGRCLSSCAASVKRATQNSDLTERYGKRKEALRRQTDIDELQTARAKRQPRLGQDRAPANSCKRRLSRGVDSFTFVRSIYFLFLCSFFVAFPSTLLVFSFLFLQCSGAVACGFELCRKKGQWALPSTKLMETRNRGRVSSYALARTTYSVVSS